jgi:hypothetical protein
MAQRGGLLGPVAVGHPNDRAMIAQPRLAHPVAPAWADPMEADLGVLHPPFPLVAAVDAGTRLSTAHQTATAQTGEHRRPPLVEASFAPLAPMGQGPVAAGEMAHLPPEPSQSLVADGMRIPQIGRQPLARGPKGRAGFHPHWYRGDIGLPAVGTLTALLLHTWDPRLDWGERDLVIDGLPLLIGLLDPVSTRRTPCRLGDDDVGRGRGQWPATTSTSHTRRALRPWAWAGRDVRLGGT